MLSMNITKPAQRIDGSCKNGILSIRAAELVEYPIFNRFR
jgi:hypothetical protein